MSDYSLQVSLPKMRADADEIQNQAQAFNNQKSEMFQFGRELDAMWEGDASQKFAQRLHADEPAFDELYQVIMEFCTVVRDSANDFENTELRIQSDIGNRGR